MTAPGVGRFFHHGWEVGAHADPLRVRIASWHEFGHAALNASTAWGALLQHLEIAERLAGDRTTPGVLRAALEAVGGVHEAYATEVSRSVLVGRAEEVDRFLRGQAGYAGFLAVAEKVGPVGADADPWRAWDGLGAVRTAALVACMQSPALSLLLDGGTERFRVADLPGVDWPSRRLRTLTRLAPRLWAEAPPPDTGDGFVPALDAASAALVAAGHPTLSRAEYLALLPALTAELARLVEDSGERVELDVDGATGIPGLFGSETVRARAPLPAAVTATLDPDAVAGLRTVHAAIPHLFLTVRRMRALRAQYDLRPDPGLANDATVAAVLTPDGAAGGVERLRLTVLHGPDEVDVLASVGPVVAGVSLDCLRDRAWRERWLPTLQARTRVVGLLDLPPEVVVPAWLRTGERLRMHLLVTTASGVPESALAFRLADEEPVILPVTGAALSALVVLVERASGGAVTLADDVPDDAATAAARLVLAHVVTEDAMRTSMRPGLW